MIAADDVGKRQAGDDGQDGPAHEMESDEGPHAVVDPDRFEPRVGCGIAGDGYGQGHRVSVSDEAQDALLGGSGRGGGGRHVFDRRAALQEPEVAVLDELVEALVRHPAQTGIVHARRAVEERAQPHLVALDQERDVAGDGMRRHRRRIRTRKTRPRAPGWPGAPSDTRWGRGGAILREARPTRARGPCAPGPCRTRAAPSLSPSKKLAHGGVAGRAGGGRWSRGGSARSPSLDTARTKFSQRAVCTRFARKRRPMARQEKEWRRRPMTLS